MMHQAGEVIQKWFLLPGAKPYKKKEAVTQKTFLPTSAVEKKKVTKCFSILCHNPEWESFRVEFQECLPAFV